MEIKDLPLHVTAKIYKELKVGGRLKHFRSLESQCWGEIRRFWIRFVDKQVYFQDDSILWVVYNRRSAGASHRFVLYCMIIMQCGNLYFIRGGVDEYFLFDKKYFEKPFQSMHTMIKFPFKIY